MPTITFYTELGTDFLYAVGRTFTPLVSYEVTLKVPTSIFNPTIVLKRDDTDISRCKECSIKYSDSSTIYYYVTDFGYVSETLCQVTLKENVLSTYSDQILSSAFFIDRTSDTTKINQRVADNYRAFVSKPLCRTYRLNEHNDTSAVYDKFSLPTSNIDTDYCYVLVLSGANYSDEYGQLLPVPDSSVLPSGFLPSVTDSGLQIVVTNGKGMHNVIDKLWDSASDRSFLVSVCRYPFAPKQGASITSFYIGKTKIDSTDDYHYFIAEPKYLIINRFSMSDFTANVSELWIEPKISVSLYLPFVGTIDLPSTRFEYSDYMSIVYYPDYATQSATCYVINETQETLLYEKKCDMSFEYPNISNNLQEIKDRLIQRGISLAVGGVGTALNLASGNAYGTARGISSLARTGGQMLGDALTTHESVSTEVNGGVEGFVSPLEAYITLIIPQPVIDRNTEGQQYQQFVDKRGLPCQSYYVISQFKGHYVKTLADPNDYSFGTEPENEEVIRLLNQGVHVY